MVKRENWNGAHAAAIYSLSLCPKNLKQNTKDQPKTFFDK
jgi:hypothetical protein